MRKPDPGFSRAALAALLFDEWRLPAHARLTVAYSGGLDSHVLLHALAMLRTTHDFRLGAIHIDHGLQSASASWSGHCAQVCRALAIPYVTRRVEVSGIAADGIEAAARRTRYAALADLVEPGSYLLTGHQRDDQAETVLLQLLRGAGVAGLAAMAERSRFGSGELLRPLLRNERSALQAYALEHQLQWIEDPSNLDVHLRRNFLRHEVLPRISHHWPDVTSKLARSAQHAADAQQLLDDLARIDLETCRSPALRPLPDGLSVVALSGLTVQRQRNVLRMWLKKKGYLPPSDLHMNTLLEQIERPSRSGHACVNWPGIEVWRYRDLLVAVPALPAADAHLDVAWDMRGVLDLPGIGQLRAEPGTGRGLVPERLKAPLHVRVRQGGERCMLPGRKHHHLLKKLLQAASVPPWERARLPLFFVGDELVAVADRWTCAPYAAGPDEEGLVIVWHPFARGLPTGRNSEKS